MKKVAYCLYGQPRNFEKAYQLLSETLLKQDIQVDFFYHTWHIDSSGETLYYETSPWINYDKSILKISNYNISKLNELYKPKAYIVEAPRTFNADIYKDTLCYKNTIKHPSILKNIPNLLSQYYSRQKVRDLFEKYILETKTIYDIVITSRFDFLKEIKLNLTTIDTSKIYTNSYHKAGNRILVNDNMFILYPENYLKLFDIYNNFDKLLNNDYISNILLKYGEEYIFNSENILLSFYFYIFKDLDNLVYTDLIPNFC